MLVSEVSGGVPIKHWTEGVEFEDEARKQVENLARMPFIYKHVAVMPDVHSGKGATVGSVIATKGAIIPAAVGVDLGCGMIAARTNLKASDLPDSLSEMRSAIESAVPHGRTNNGGAGDRGAWGNIPDIVKTAWIKDGRGEGALFWRFEKLIKLHPDLAKSNNVNHLGTLGTGNHFWELSLDENQDVWVMLHSGSRGVGGRIGSYFIELAKKDMRKWFINIPDVDLSYFPEGTDHFDEYCEAVQWAQDYALANRRIMLDNGINAIQSVMKRPIVLTEEAVQCHHNYISQENHFGSNVYVTRKGAVMAREGVLGIIPGSMGAKSYIVRGKGNRDSFHSCSHGAGRRMSRTEARRRFTVDDHIKATEGVECRKDADVIDETPACYKSIDSVMNAQKDLVDIAHTLKAVLCIKG